MQPIKISKKFKPLFDGGYLYYAFYGGRGSGKSHGVAEYAVKAALSSHEKIFTARQFKNSTDISSKALYENKIKRLHLEHEFEIRDKWIECKSTGSLFQFIGLERNPDNVRSLEGATLTILEEAQNLTAYAIQTIQATVMRDKYSRMVFNWNPINKDDPVDKMFRGSHPPDQAYICEMSWRDNPYFYDTQLPAQMEHMKQVNFGMYNHVWEGDYYGGFERRIFNNWQIADVEVPDHIFPQYGLDFGTKDPNAIVKIYVNEKERWIYIAREFKAAGTLDLVLTGLESVAENNDAKIVADSAWPQSISVIKKKYPRIIGAKKGQNSVLAGIKWLQDYTLYISPNCPQMRFEAENYSWQFDKHSINDDGSPQMLDVPEDDHNHLWDAVRYASEQNRIEGNKTVKVGRVRL